MTSPLVIITPGIVAGSGGVADHTLALLREWSPLQNLTLLVATSGKVAHQWSETVRPLDQTSDAIFAQLPSNGGRVFVQYSAYGFNRFGYPRDLIRALVQWKKRAGRQLVIMFHEIWTFWPFTNKNFIIQQLHRRALRQLIKVCDSVFTTTSSQAEYLRRLNNASVHVVPAGSNVPRQSSNGATRTDKWAALFGLQNTRVRALEHMRKSLTALGAANQITRIICLGSGTDTNMARREREMLSRLNLSEGFAQHGTLDPDDVSEVLNSVSFGVFGQNELSCTKSGSFMAYAAHQLCVLADFANPSKPPPVCWLVAPNEILSGIEPRELQRRAECLRMWQEQNCSWKVIANKIGSVLAIESSAT